MKIKKISNTTYQINSQIVEVDWLKRDYGIDYHNGLASSLIWYFLHKTPSLGKQKIIDYVMLLKSRNEELFNALNGNFIELK